MSAEATQPPAGGSQLKTNILSVGVVITTYNAEEKTNRALSAVLQHAGNSISTIIVVDDKSEPPFQCPPHEKITVLRNHSNLGYVGAVNAGFAAIATDVVILLDLDAYVLADVGAIAAAKFSADPELGLLGFSLTDEAGRPTGSSDSEPTVSSLLLGNKLNSKMSRRWPRRTAPIFLSCAVAIRRECFAELEGFDPGFEFYEADVDFGMRLNRSHWRAVACPELRAVHEGHGSPQSYVRRVMLFHVNRFRLLKKHGMLPYPRLVQWAVLTRIGVERCVLAVLSVFDRSARRAQQRESRKLTWQRMFYLNVDS